MKLNQLKTLGKAEMLLPELIGKVAERLPIPSGDRPFFQHKQRLNEALAIVQEFIEQGDVTLRKEVVKENEQFKTFNRVTIVGGKDKVKDITKGFETVPGKVYQKDIRGHRLRPDDKAHLKTLSSIKFYRSEFCTEEYLKEIQALVPVDPSNSELKWKKEARYDMYRKEILAIDSFYLATKFDGRGRMYYEGATLEGFRPQGKAYESFMFELAPRKLSEEGKEILDGLHYKEGVLKDLRVKQVTKAVASGYTGMTVECDITNSGLLIAGLSFRSPEMLSATNGYAGVTKADSHKIFGNAYGLSREDAKKIHTPLLHGASNFAIAKVLSKVTGKYYSEEDVYEANEEAYGRAVHNIGMIAEYGADIMSNTRSEVSWSMPDGLRATHRAYTDHIPLELVHESRKVKVFKEMPMLFDGSGYPVYDSKAPNAKESTRSHLRGLYANIIHSIDAYVMREIINSGMPLLAKHDAFFVHPNDVEQLKLMLQGIYSEIQEEGVLLSILEQIEEETGVEAPELFIGNAESRMKDSHMFMTVE